MVLKYKSYWRKTGLKGKWGNIYLDQLNKYKPKNFLEIGVFCGVTARNTCDYLNQIHGDEFKYIGVDLFGTSQKNLKDEIKPSFLKNQKFSNPLKNIYYNYILKENLNSLESNKKFLQKIDNQYDLVLLAKERTVQLNAGAPMLVEEDNDKRTIISLREIGDGKISVKELEESSIKRLRKEPDEAEQQEEIEEETNDDFENLYKGQISKSGVAILPSKRTRKIPEVKKQEESNLAKEAISELKSEQPEIKEENLDKEESPLELKEEVPKEEENKSE